MPRPKPSDDRRPDRTAAERAADHAAIDRLADELLPALIAKLGATGLGELEVREGSWRVRLRRPGGPAATSSRGRRTAERPGRPDDGHAERLAHAGAKAGHQGPDGSTARTGSRAVATSPAVGIFQPRADLAAGSRVRAGDRLGAVDMLGVAQEVVAPADGILGARLVEPGDAVEYGQELLIVELAPVSPASGSGNGTT